MHNGHMDRIAAYERISREDPASTSIEKQHERILAEIETRGLPAEGVEVFRDVGVSGSKAVRRPARDDLERRLADFDLLFVNSLDRLARSTSDFVRIADAAMKVGCRIVVVSQPELDFTNPHGRFMAELMSILAAFEARLVGERMRQTNEHLVRQGKRTGGVVPFGFRNVVDPDGGYVLRPDEETSAYVLEAVERVLEGGSVRGVALDWSRRGVPSPRNGDGWDVTSLSRLLRRPALAGMRVFRGALVRDPATGLPLVDEEAALIDRATFDRLQDALAGRGGGSKTWTPRSEMLSGLAVCQDGETMYPNRARSQFRYVCSCSAPRRVVSMRASDLEGHVVGEFLARYGDQDLVSVSVAPAVDYAALGEVQEEIDRVSEALRTARGDDRRSLFETLTTLQDTEDRLMTTSDPDSLGLLDITPTGMTVRVAWESASPEERHSWLAHSIDRVVVSSATHRGRVDLSRVTIEWDAGVSPDSVTFGRLV